MNIELRYQQVKDAKRFVEILNHPDFIYFPVKPKTIKEEIDFLRNSKKRRLRNYCWDYSILLDGQVIGAIGIKINQHRTYIGEIGYFIDANYWGKNIATEAVQMIEKIGFNELKLSRIEILMEAKNIGSERVAIKAGYQKEGILRQAIPTGDRTLVDGLLYAKLK